MTGYVTDVAYVRSFYESMTPETLRAAAALSGFIPPPERGFDYCELGIGRGDTLIALAAAHPHARFVGVDLNPEHIAFAQGVAQRGSVNNARFVECDFENLEAHGIANLDFVVAHGLFSWVSAEKRKVLARVVSAALKNHGLFYVSYNALPGWAALEPLRKLLLASSAQVEGGTLARARHGVELAQKLLDGGASYFADNPGARTMLAMMTKAGLPYVVHEYFNEGWHPMYFEDVAREMSHVGLEFVGQLPIHSNLRELTVPPALAPMFEDIRDPIAAETLKDFVTNESFRVDVYVKGGQRSPQTTQSYLSTARFGTLKSSARIPRERAFAQRTLDLKGPVFEALIERLAAHASTLPELAAHPTLSVFGADEIRTALLQLVFAEIAKPRPTEATVSGAEAYNRMVLSQPLSSGDPFVFASPLAGTGLALSTLDTACLRLFLEVPAAEREAWIREFIATSGRDLTVRGERIEDAQARARVFTEQFEKFVAQDVSKLIELGIVTPS